MSQTISQKALIREMDADELVNYLGQLADVDDTTGLIPALVLLCAAQYQQLTGEALTIHSDGMTVASAAMLLGVQNMCNRKNAAA